MIRDCVMPPYRCPYFTLHVGEIPIPGFPHPMRFPICRCVLTETFVDRLSAHPEGEPLASYLVGPPLDGQPRPVIGSDLNPISPSSCTNQRKQDHCIPHFVAILTDFGLDITLPEEP